MLRTLLTVLFTAPFAFAAPSVTISDGKLVLVGVGSSKGLSVVVAEGTEDEIAARPTMNGEWTAQAGKVIFTPKHALKPGTRYRVLGTGDKLEVRVPAAERSKATTLTGILPPAGELPENVLRFYLEFNQPMPRGGSYKHVQVVTEKGTPVEQPFLELDDELWNPDQTRLTLLIDPGRLKREVKPRLDLGPVFEAGKKYTLVVRGTWPTLDGGTLGNDVSKPILATTRLADGIDPKLWKLSAPSENHEELTVTFGRPMDHALVLRSLSVIDPNGRELPGTAELRRMDQGWVFRPSVRWAAGDYKLRVDPILEDVCGNGIGRPFEIDIRLPEPKAGKAGPVELPFSVGKR